MSLSAERIEADITACVPVLEKELGTLGFPFELVAAEYRMRIRGACGIVSEILSQRFRMQGLDAETRIRDVSELSTQHVITVIEGERPLIVDGSYSQLMVPFGLDYLEAYSKEPRIRFPEERALVFYDGQQAEIAEWMTWISSIADPQVDSAAAFRYYGSLWDLDEYEPWNAPDYIQEKAAELATDWSENLQY